MLTHHWEQYDLTCNGKEVTETQTDGKLHLSANLRQPMRSRTKAFSLTQTHSTAFESYCRPGRSKIFDEKTMK